MAPLEVSQITGFGCPRQQLKTYIEPLGKNSLWTKRIQVESPTLWLKLSIMVSLSTHNRWSGKCSPKLLGHSHSSEAEFLAWLRSRIQTKSTPTGSWDPPPQYYKFKTPRKITTSGKLSQGQAWLSSKIQGKLPPLSRVGSNIAGIKDPRKKLTPLEPNTAQFQDTSKAITPSVAESRS